MDPHSSPFTVNAVVLRHNRRKHGIQLIHNCHQRAIPRDRAASQHTCPLAVPSSVIDDALGSGADARLIPAGQEQVSHDSYISPQEPAPEGQRRRFSAISLGMPSHLRGRMMPRTARQTSEHRLLFFHERNFEHFSTPSARADTHGLAVLPSKARRFDRIMPAWLHPMPGHSRTCSFHDFTLRVRSTMHQSCLNQCSWNTAHR
jgi:hypothetical protein